MNFLKTLFLSLIFSVSAFAGKAVNINTADAATLAETLDGVGVKRAEAIIAYRNEHGPFKKVEDLEKVQGISAKTVEKNRAMILLEDTPVAPATTEAPKQN